MTVPSMSIHPRAESLSEQVYSAIRSAIVGKSLAPGSTVTEAQLAQHLGVSKTPVREALLRLRDIGLVQPLPARGVKVIEPTREAILGAYEVRSMLEVATAALASRRVRPAAAAELASTAERSLLAARAHDAESFRELDLKFHTAIWRASANPTMERLADNAYALTSALRAMDTPIEGNSITCAEQHVTLARAIAAGDERTARLVAREHIESVRQSVMAPADGTHAHERPTGTE